MSLTLEAIARAMGGRVCGSAVRCPTPGHSRADDGTSITIVPGAPDGVLVQCHNGGVRDALLVKDQLRAAGILFERQVGKIAVSLAELNARRAEDLARRAAKHEKAAVRAAQILAKSEPAQADHPYLVSKRIIRPERLWQRKGELLVPMQDIRGKLWNVQRIPQRPGATGKWPKFFCAGGRAHDLFWWVGEPQGELILTEGMATAAAIRQATGAAVVSAMSADNLSRVAQAFREVLPTLSIIIAADDDEAGHMAARDAAKGTAARIVLPRILSHA